MARWCYRPMSARSVPSRTKEHTEGNPLTEYKTPDPLLTPAEVAAMFRVNPKTVTRWARAGKITAIRTLGGHRRFRTSEIQRCMDEVQRMEV